MRNQFFGDVRDLFKYDLITWLIQNINSIDQFAFIPMLTEDDDKDHGLKMNYAKAKAGTNNTELVKILEGCVNRGKRDIRQIKSYFRG